MARDAQRFKKMISLEELKRLQDNKVQTYETALSKFIQDVITFYDSAIEEYQSQQGKYFKQKDLDDLQIFFNGVQNIFNDFSEYSKIIGISTRITGINKSDLDKFANDLFSLIQNSLSKHLHFAKTELVRGGKLGTGSNNETITKVFTNYIRAFNWVHPKSVLPFIGQNTDEYRAHFSELDESTYNNTIKFLDEGNLEKVSNLNALFDAINNKVKILLAEIEEEIKKTDSNLLELKGKFIGSLQTKTERRKRVTMRLLKK